MNDQLLQNDSIEKKSQEYLDKLVREHLVFIDTCSWMDDSITSFVDHLMNPLKSQNLTVYLALSVRKELQKFLDDSQNIERHKKAIRAANEINRLNSQQLLVMIGDDKDSFTDNILLSMFNKYRLKKRMALITQDRALGNDILSLNNIKSSVGFPVVVRRINKYGYLSPLNDTNDTGKVTGLNRATPTFKLCSEIIKIANHSLKVSVIPTEGDTVIIGGIKHRLVKRIGGGGEGDVFSASSIPGKIVKIYNSAHLDLYRKQKIELMLTNKINYPGICWPEEIVTNLNGEFVGYLMPEAKGRTPQRSIFIKPLFEKYFPNWTRKDLVQLCLTVLEKIEYLHKNNIIIGDINPENILISSPTEVYFVDCDSYQVEGFPCPVGTVNFTPPELQGKRYDTLLRTFGNEYFAVATLLFMFMMPGKPPYSQQGGGNPAENIRGMDFSYPFGEQSNKKQPDGLWRFMWSHLPRRIKEMFYNSFRKGAPNSSERMRFTTQQWLNQFKEYKKLLDDGTMRKNDEQSEWIYPTRFKHFVTKCKTCGRDVYQTDLSFGNCPECDAKLRPACKGCRKRFFENQLKDGYCKDCNDETVKTLMCRNPNCHKFFKFTRGEQFFYRSNGWEDPPYCPECRKARKSNNGYYSSSNRSYYSNSTYQTSQTYRQPQRSTPTPSPKKSGWCFITTAACEFLGKPDDCWELMLLRHFRDHYMKATPEGCALVEKYYDIAPAIVTVLNESDQRELIYTMLWQNYIRPCLQLIVDEKPGECQQLYSDMVDMLQNHIQYCAKDKSQESNDSDEINTSEIGEEFIKDDDSSSDGVANITDTKSSDESREDTEGEIPATILEGIPCAESILCDEDTKDTTGVEKTESGIEALPSEYSDSDLDCFPIPRLPIVLCVDISKTMSSEAMERLNETIVSLHMALYSDEVLQYSVELCVISFDSEAMLTADFCSINEFEYPKLNSRGKSMHIGKGINMAIDMLEQRKQKYREVGVDYYQPVLIVLTGGRCLGESIFDRNNAIDRAVKLSKCHQLHIIPVRIGLGETDDILNRLSSKGILNTEGNNDIGVTITHDFLLDLVGQDVEPSYLYYSQNSVIDPSDMHEITGWESLSL